MRTSGWFGALLVVLAVPAAAGDWWEDATRPLGALVKRQGSKESGAITMVDWSLPATGTGAAGVTTAVARTVAWGAVDMKRAVNEAHAFLLAEEAARSRALRQLVEEVQGVAVSSSTLLRSELLADSQLRASLDGFLRARSTGTPAKSKLPDGSLLVRVEMEAILQGAPGSLASWCLQNDCVKDAQPGGVTSTTVRENPVPGVPGPAVRQTVAHPDANLLEPAPDVRKGEDFDGLVLDATGLGAGPSLFPRILTRSGEVIYSLNLADRKHAAERGLAGWADTVAAARSQSKRIGKNPLVLKAVAVSGDNRSDFVVDDAAKTLIQATISRKDFFKDCGVVIVIGHD